MSAVTEGQRLADALHNATPLEALSEPPATVADAYAIQDAMRVAMNLPVIGWKVAQATPAAQKAAGLEAPTVSPLLGGMIVPDGTVFPKGRFMSPEAEAEIAIELSAPLAGAVTPSEVVAAVAGMRFAIEVPDSRYTDKKALGAKSVIADMNSSAALIVGELQPLDTLGAAMASTAEMQLGDGTIVNMVPPDFRPDPLAVVAFLAGFVAERGERLEAGAIITTGTHTPPTRTGPGTLVATFSGVGSVSCVLSEPAA